MIVFLEVTPKWPAASSPIRACSAADRRAQTWSGERWAAAIHDPGSVAFSAFNGEIGSELEAGSSAVVLAEKYLLDLYPGAKTVRWEGADYRLWAGTFTTLPGSGTYPYPNTVTQISAGRVTRFEKEGGAIKLSLDPGGTAAITTVLDREYAGTGGAEGGPDRKGTLKPWIFGHAQNVEPILIDEDNSVYQFSGYGAIQSVDVLYERGASFGAPVGDYADYAALVAATIPAGRWATCLALGMVRLGAPQFGVITGDLKGDYSGSVQRRLPGAILQRIAAHRSIASAAIDTASLSALDSFAATLPSGGNISLVLTEQTTFLDLARRLCAQFNAQAGFTLMGKLIASRVAIGSPSFTIDARGRRLPLVGGFIEADTPPPYKRIIMSGEPSWRVNDLSTEIAFYAPPRPAGQYSATETYREGDVVTISDGSTWLYINPVASSGNAPPQWPVTSSSYWSNLTQPLDRGKVFVQSAAPSAAESTVGDIWLDDNGRYWIRRGDNHLAIGGKRIMLGGKLLTMMWTPTPSQPVRDGIDAALATAIAATDAAKQLALDAQATADGKVQSFYQAAAPVAEGVGDLWFDTDDGNKQYRWSGSGWVPVQDTKIGAALTAAAGAQATADGKVATFISEAAPVAEGIGDLWFKASTGELRRWSGAAWGDPLVDLTAAAQVIVVPAPTFTLYRTSAGAVKPDQLPASLRPSVTKGGVDKRTDNSVSYSVTGYGALTGKVTVNSTNGSAGKGDVTLANTITGEGYFELSVTVGGISVGVYQTQVVTVDDLPPINNGGAGGTDTTLATITSTTYAAMTGQDAGDPVLDVAITSGQVLKLNANFKYQHTPSTATGSPLAMKCKGQYSSDGTNWFDMDSATTEVTGSASTAGAPEDRIKGELIATFEKSGLATGTYKVRLMGKFNSSATGNLQPQTGSATSSKS